MKRPRVLVADDHRMVAEGICSLLEPEFDLLGVVEDGRAMVEAARTLKPDVIVADVSMPHLNGIDALVVLRRDDPDVRMVFLTMHTEVAYARRALDAGALGYVLKHAAPADLVSAVRAALAGQTYLPPSMAGAVLADMRDRPDATTEPSATLTPRQREVLHLLVEGRTAKEIANDLGISVRTVEYHKYRMMETVQVHTVAELVRYAVKHAIVDP